MTMLQKTVDGERMTVRTHEEMGDVLMHPEASGPFVHYYMIRGGSSKKNITVWENGTVGGEYVKAYGHYHVNNIGETYQILSGSGIVLLQEREKDEDGNMINDTIASIKAIFVSAGDTVHIPATAGHLMVNTGVGWLVTSDDSPLPIDREAHPEWPMHADYESVKSVHGFGYYVVEQDGKHAFVKNPHYKKVPDIVVEHATEQSI